MAKDNLAGTKALLASLVRMKPKQHENMKLGNAKAKAGKKKKARPERG